MTLEEENEILKEALKRIAAGECESVRTALYDLKLIASTALDMKQ